MDEVVDVEDVGRDTAVIRAFCFHHPFLTGLGPLTKREVARIRT